MWYFLILWPCLSTDCLCISSCLCCILSWAQFLSPIVIVLTHNEIILNKILFVLLMSNWVVFFFHKQNDDKEVEPDSSGRTSWEFILLQGFDCYLQNSSRAKASSIGFSFVNSLGLTTKISNYFLITKSNVLSFMNDLGTIKNKLLLHITS